MSETTVTPQQTNSQRIYQVIVDCKNLRRVCTRRVILDTTGLKPTIVDDHIKRMKADEKIITPLPGYYEPAEPPHQDRAVSSTFLDNGKVKIEIGDDEVILSMREGRLVWLALGGIDRQFGR